MDLDSLLKRMLEVFTGQERKKVDIAIRLNSTAPMSINSLCTPKLLADTVTSYALNMITQERERSSNYIVNATNTPGIYKVKRMNGLPGQYQSDVSHECDIIKKHCDCGFMDNRLMACRHLICVT